MIVLDAMNKSLQIINGINNLVSVISYWSIDSSNVWTPHNFEKISASSASPSTVLAAPSTGETRVVENVWFHFPTALSSGQFVFLLDVATVQHIIAEFRPAVPQATTLSLSRDGAWTRQRAGFVNAGAAAVTENVF